MDFDFSYTFGNADGFGPLLFGALAGVILIASVFVALFELLQYILTACSTYSIAKRRGIRHAWLGWIPVARQWLLGCISDQYQFVVRGKVRYNRLVLLILSLVQLVAGSWASGNLVRMIYGFEPPMAILMLNIVAGCVALAAYVFHMIALYDLYTSCTPQNNVLFLVLSIFLPVTEPFFLIAVHKKDEGMPPRKVHTEAPQPDPF